MEARVFELREGKSDDSGERNPLKKNILSGRRKITLIRLRKKVKCTYTIHL